MHSNRKFLLLAVISAAGIACLPGCSSAPPAPSVPASSWVESSLRRMTLEEKVGQMVMARAYGYYYSDQTDEFRRLAHLVKDGKVGGFCFFQGDVYETALLSNRLQEMAAVPLLMAGDYEWGTAMRIRRGTRFPEAMALGATRDTALARAVGKATGEEARALGVGMDFAPVADVNVNPDNPVINTRSFGEDPSLVASMASAFARGLAEGGVVATAKHFPGHGDTQTDSHLNLPLIPHTRARLDSVELVPFARLIAQGIPAVMVAHLEVPSLQGQRSLPATLSPYVMTGVLRGDLGFRGLVVTDAMDMGALVNGFDSTAVRAVEAGADVLLIPPDEDAAIAAVAAAVRSGRIPEARIDLSVRRILGVKESLGLAARKTVDIAALPSRVETPDHLALAKRAARASMTLLRNNGVLPLGRGSRMLVAAFSDIEQNRTEINRPSSQWTSEPAGDYFIAQFRRRASSVASFRVDPTNLDVEGLLKAGKRAEIIVCPIYSRARSGSGQFGLPPELIAAVDTLCSLRKPVVIIAMGSPYLVGSWKRGAAYLCTYSDAEQSSDAAVEALFGEIPTGGKLPVTIPGMFTFGSGIDLRQTVVRRDVPEAVGMNRDSLSRLDTLIARALKDSAFPGGELLVMKEGAIVVAKPFGTLDYSPGSPAVTNATLYDLASMTKVFATTPAIMRLLDEGKIALDDPVVKYIPEFGNRGKEGITIRNLLLHNGGLPPFKLLFKTVKSPQELLDSVYRTEMVYRTGDSTLYSDFDFILLGKIVERAAGCQLDHYADSVFYAPLGMGSTMYKPGADLLASIAPTEVDTGYRRTTVHGVVHDENAYALGGVSGHAGLFSNSTDLAIFVEMLLEGGRYAGRQYVKPETVKLFTSRQGAGVRGLGWDMKTMNGYSSAGSLMSDKTFGHTGFTGTSVWVDPTRNLAVILLTNRVHPTRANNKITKVRPLIHDAVVRAILP